LANYFHILAELTALVALIMDACIRLSK